MTLNPLQTLHDTVTLMRASERERLVRENEL
jgi:hypothetical protein